MSTAEPKLAPAVTGHPTYYWHFVDVVWLVAFTSLYMPL